jgi:hypothetical protein
MTLTINLGRSEARVDCCIAKDGGKLIIKSPSAVPTFMANFFPDKSGLLIRPGKQATSVDLCLDDNRGHSGGCDGRGARAGVAD